MKPKENSITPSLKGAVTNYLTILKLLNMRKKIFSGLFALSLLVATGYGVNQSMKSDDGLSDLALANVEALASGETSEEFYEATGCYATIRDVSCTGKDGNIYSFASKDNPYP